MAINMRTEKTIGFFFIILFWMIAVITGKAQTSYQLSVDNVLPSNYVRAMVQDRYGYVWMGTTSGLVRYDGYQAEVFRPSLEGTQKLMQDFRIQDAKLWNDRFVWIRLRGRLYSCYDTQANKFVDFTGDGTYGTPILGYTFLQDDDMVVWNGKGCRRIHFDGNRFTAIAVNLPKGDILKYLQGGQSEYVVYRDGRVFQKKYVGKDSKYTLILSKRKENLENVEYFQGKIYMIGRRLYEFDIKHRKCVPSRLGVKRPQAIKDNKGNLIILSDDGQDVCYLTPQRVYRFGGIYNSSMLRLNNVPNYKCYTSQDGVLWMTAYGNGLFSYDPKTGVLKSYASYLPSPYTLGVMVDCVGNVWVSLENLGISVLNLAKSSASYIYLGNNKGINNADDIRLLKGIGQYIYANGRQNTFCSFNTQLSGCHVFTNIGDDVTAIESDKQGRLWVGTRKKGIYVGTPNRLFEGTRINVSNNKVSDILMDRKGRMWVTLFRSGLHIWDGTKLEPVIVDAELQLRNMEMDKSGRVWIASSKGALVFNPSELLKNKKAFGIEHVSATDRVNDEVHSIYCDSHGRIWVGSIGNGVMLIDGGKKKIYTTHDGLADNNVQSIVEDRLTGDIWLGTDKGLSRFRHGVFNNFYFGVNYLANSCTEDNAIQLADGRLAFATHNGILYFHPKDIHQDFPKFPLSVARIEANGVSIEKIENGVKLQGPMGKAEKLTVDYEMNSLTFYFSDFYYASKSSSSFMYWLEGYDKDWSNLSRINFAQYRNLPVGEYILHVRSCNANGVWTAEEAVLQVVVRPPFYATWWACLIYMLLIAVVMYYVFVTLRRINRLRNAVVVEKQLTEYKLRFFTNISHEFRTPLTIIRGDMELMRTVDNVPGAMKQPLESMKKSVDRMIRLINQLLEFRKMQNNKLSLALEKTNVISFLQDIVMDFNSIAEKKQIALQFLPFDKSYEMYIDQSYLDKIVYNLLSNAMKYTPSKECVVLRVSLSEKEEMLVLSVEDTGIGVEKEKQQHLFERFNRSSYLHDSIGIGLHLTAELVRVHHGTISYQSNHPQGSIFVVKLPLSSTVYDDSDFMVEKDNESRVGAGDERAQGNIHADYQEIAPEPMNSQKVLIVDDDNDVREFLAQVLRKYFHVMLASDGLEAWNVIQDDAPALIVSDVKMPRMDGYQLTKKVRADQSLRDIPVILLTALTADEQQVKGMDVGADAYIRKPFSVKILVTQCSQLIEQRQNLKLAYASKTTPSVVPPPGIIVEEQDRKFRMLLETWLERHIADPQLNIELFAESMGYGRTTFYKKVKKVLGTTPNEYIRSVRMNKAADLLRNELTLSVAEVGYKVGMDDPYYFSKLFKNFFGVSPSKYRSGEMG